MRNLATSLSLATLAATAFSQSAPTTDRKPLWPSRHIVLSKKSPALAIGLIVVGGLLLVAHVDAQGGAASGTVSVDDSTRLLGGGLIILGLDQMPAPQSWAPRLSFSQHRSRMLWTIGRW